MDSAIGEVPGSRHQYSDNQRREILDALEAMAASDSRSGISEAARIEAASVLYAFVIDPQANGPEFAEISERLRRVYEQSGTPGVKEMALRSLAEFVRTARRTCFWTNHPPEQRRIEAR